MVSFAFHRYGDCERLEEIELADCVHHLDSKAFYGCKNLVWVILPDTLTDIGALAFGNCVSLESIASYRREEKISLGLIVLTEDELGYYPIDFMNKSMKSYKSLRESFMEDTQGVVISLRNIVEVKRGEKAKTFVVKTGTEEYSFGVVKNNSKK